MSPTLGELATAVLQKKYEKPTTGIPLNDLEDNALDDYATKADTVLTTTLSRGRKENTTVGTGSFAFGDNIEASQIYSHAEGAYTIASGNASHAEGVSTTASGNYSHAEGNRTVASGHNSHAEGLYAIASGLAAHAEGYYTEAQRFSHVGGAFNIVDSYDSWPEWSANTSYSVGDKVKITTVSDNVTTVTGYKCKTANSDASFTAANWTNQYGQMNYAEIIGNGTSDARSNARALDWDGNEHLMGDVYVGCNADSSGGIKLARLGDIQINGTSIVSGGVANIPFATNNSLGVVQTSQNYGTSITSTGIIVINTTNAQEIKNGSNVYRPITPSNQHSSVFYGLAKAAGDSTQSASSNAVGTYTDNAKTAIRTMLGATSSNVIAVQDEQPTDSDTKIWLPETAETPVEVPTVAEMNAALAGKVGDVRVNGTSIVNNGTANIHVSDGNSNDTPGLITVVNEEAGLKISSNGHLGVVTATSSYVKAGSNYFRSLVPAIQHESAFYGLAKAAGDATQASSANAVGTYTDDAKSAIQTMLGIDSLIAAKESDYTADRAYAIGDVFMLDGKLYKATAAIALDGTIAPGTNCDLTNISHENVIISGTGIGSVKQKDYFIAQVRYSNTATMYGSVAFGANTTASGVAAMAENYLTIASGTGSHAEGNHSYARGKYSHAEGFYTIANASYSHTSGIYNVEDSYSSWPEWAANTSYSIGDKVKITTTSNGVTTVTGYVCK